MSILSETWDGQPEMTHIEEHYDDMMKERFNLGPLFKMSSNACKAFEMHVNDHEVFDWLFSRRGLLDVRTIYIHLSDIHNVNISALRNINIPAPEANITIRDCKLDADDICIHQENIPFGMTKTYVENTSIRCNNLSVDEIQFHNCKLEVDRLYMRNQGIYGWLNSIYKDIDPNFDFNEAERQLKSTHKDSIDLTDVIRIDSLLRAMGIDGIDVITFISKNSRVILSQKYNMVKISNH